MAGVLARFPLLRHLEVSDANLLAVYEVDTLDSIRELGHALGAMQHLEHLDMSKNLQDDSEAHKVDVIVRALAPGLFSSHTLKMLILDNWNGAAAAPETWPMEYRLDVNNGMSELVACMLAARERDALAWSCLETISVRGIGLPACLGTVLSAALQGVRVLVE